MKNKVKVLVAGSGNVTGLNVIRALVGQPDVKVIGCDFDAENPSKLFCPSFEVPLCADSRYPSSILELVKRQGITHIIASNDHDVRALTQIKQNNKEFPIFNGFCNNTLACLDKRETEQLFVKAGVRTPLIVKDRSDYPYVLRIENMGKVKKFVHIIKNQQDAEAVTEDEYKAGIMTRYVEGTEYTVDVLCDSQSRLLSAVPRERITIVGGMVHHARIVYDEELIAQCAKIALSAGLVGMSCIQCIKTEDNQYYFIEINPRPGSGIDLSINAGVNMPLLWLEETSGEAVEVPEPIWGMQMKRYFCGYYY